MSGITTTGATILNNIENSPKGILIWRAMLAMAWWNWCNFNGYNFDANYEYWWNAIIKISSYDTSEKILPKSKEISLRLITVYLSLTFFVQFFIKFLE